MTDPPRAVGEETPLDKAMARIYDAGPRDGFVPAMLWQDFLTLRKELAQLTLARQQVTALQQERDKLAIIAANNIVRAEAAEQQVQDLQQELDKETP